MKTIKDIPRPFFEIYYFCAVTAFTIIYTLPLIANLAGVFYGFPWDSLGGIWDFWWLKFSYLHNLSLTIHTYKAYPFGKDLAGAPFPYLFNLSGFVLTYFTNEVIAFNIIKLISFPLLALTTYLLIYYLTKDKLVSALIGLIYTFSPFHVIHNMAHFANLYWLPLAILFLLKLLKEGSYRNATLFGLFWGFTFVDNAYYGYFIGLLLPVFVFLQLFSNDTRINITNISFLKASLVAILVFFLTLLPMFYPTLKLIFVSQVKDSVRGGFVRPFSELFIFSARPLDYLLPSIHNPFLGWLSLDFVMSSLKGQKYIEQTLYLGYIMLLLGGYGFYSTLNKRRQSAANKEEWQTVYLFFVVAIIAAILSAPPFISIGGYQIDFQAREDAGYKLYLPQYLLYKLFPMFRVYARMGVIVLLALCVLAAFGLKEILSRVNARKWRHLLLFFFSLIVFIEYAEFPPFRLTRIQVPEVYKWLASQPGEFAIVEYPFGVSVDPYTTYEYYFYQRIHEKYLVNGASEGTSAEKFWREVIDISKDETIDKLSKIDVKYILFHKYKYIKGNEYMPIEGLTKPSRDKVFPPWYDDGRIPDAPLNRLRLIKDFGDTSVYEIIR